MRINEAAMIATICFAVATLLTVWMVNVRDDPPWWVEWIVFATVCAVLTYAVQWM